MKRWKFSQKKLEIVLKGKSLNKTYRFNQEEFSKFSKEKRKKLNFKI
jgi:hypothetical protein